MDLEKSIRVECFTVSAIVCREPCWLFSIIGCSSQTTSAILTVRDGILAVALAKMLLYCSCYSNPVVVFNQPVYFKNGLYLDFGSGVSAVTVQYKPGE
jgi:hypothetical protein